MLIDKRTSFFDDETVTADKVGNSIDMLTTGFHGAGNPLYFCVAYSGLDRTSGNETYQITLEDGSAVNNAGQVTTGKAAVAGGRIDIPATPASGFVYSVISGTENLKRYMHAYLDVGGTTPSIKLTAWIQGEKPEQSHVYDDAITFATNA